MKKNFLFEKVRSASCSLKSLGYDADVIYVPDLDSFQLALYKPNYLSLAAVRSLMSVDSSFDVLVNDGDLYFDFNY